MNKGLLVYRPKNLNQGNGKKILKIYQPHKNGGVNYSYIQSPYKVDMVGAMLVGAWILIHQQCCVTGEIESRSHNSMFDPLIRRSALEKNFMRYGRSLLSKEIEFNQNEETRVKINLLGFGPSNGGNHFLRPAPHSQVLIGSNGKEMDESSRNDLEKAKTEEISMNLNGFPRLRKNKSFIRFGRAKKKNFNRFSRAGDQFLRFGRNEDPLRLKKEKDNSEANRKKSNFLRLGKRDENFMRFGRVKDKFMSLASGTNFFNLARKENENLTRSKRHLNENLIPKNREQEINRFSRQKQMDKDGFIRFGRSLKESGNKLDSTNYCLERKSFPESFNYNYCQGLFDPNLIVLQDFSLLQQILIKLTLGARPINKLSPLGY